MNIAIIQEFEERDFSCVRKADHLTNLELDNLVDKLVDKLPQGQLSYHMRQVGHRAIELVSLTENSGILGMDAKHFLLDLFHHALVVAFTPAKVDPFRPGWAKDAYTKWNEICDETFKFKYGRITDWYWYRASQLVEEFLDNEYEAHIKELIQSVYESGFEAVIDTTAEMCSMLMAHDDEAV